MWERRPWPPQPMTAKRIRSLAPAARAGTAVRTEDATAAVAAAPDPFKNSPAVDFTYCHCTSSPHDNRSVANPKWLSQHSRSGFYSTPWAECSRYSRADPHRFLIGGKHPGSTLTPPKFWRGRSGLAAGPSGLHLRPNWPRLELPRPVGVACRGKIGAVVRIGA